jgi:hypothetical protein
MNMNSKQPKNEVDHTIIVQKMTMPGKVIWKYENVFFKSMGCISKCRF